MKPEPLWQKWWSHCTGRFFHSFQSDITTFQDCRRHSWSVLEIFGRSVGLWMDPLDPCDVSSASKSDSISTDVTFYALTWSKWIDPDAFSRRWILSGWIYPQMQTVSFFVSAFPSMHSALERPSKYFIFMAHHCFNLCWHTVFLLWRSQKWKADVFPIKKSAL